MHLWVQNFEVLKFGFVKRLQNTSFLNWKVLTRQCIRILGQHKVKLEYLSLDGVSLQKVWKQFEVQIRCCTNWNQLKNLIVHRPLSTVGLLQMIWVLLTWANLVWFGGYSMLRRDEKVWNTNLFESCWMVVFRILYLRCISSVPPRIARIANVRALWFLTR